MIGHIRWFIDFGYHFQIVDALADGHAQLVSVDDSSKWFLGSLPLSAFAQKVFISREQNSTQFSAAIQQFRVFQHGGSVFLRGQHIVLLR